MTKKSYTYQIIILSLLSFSMTLGKHFIFDFGGVLVTTNKYKSFQHLGLTNLAECTIRLGLNPFKLNQYITTTLFATLDSIEKEYTLRTINPYYPAYDEKGNQLPLLMCTWLQGSMTCSEIRCLINQAIDEHPQWFKCNAEQRMIKNILRMIFTPEYFIDSRTISYEGIEFIKKCKLKGHTIYGLSNWDTESFVLLKAKYPELFDLFDGIVISGEINANKPHETIYQTLLQRYTLQPQDCWFIDDQKENIIAAQKLNINAVMYISSFKQVIEDIKIAYSKSVIRRENLNNNGNIETNTNTINNIIIDGENISLTDSTI